jgi:putative phage-type endonuclease
MPRLSPQQKADRRLGIGSSDIAELLGISPYEGASPVRLFAEKIGMLPDDDEETLEQEVGHALEGALARMYEAKSGHTVITSGEYVESVCHPVHRWRRANLDGRIEGKRAALEIKCVGIGMAADWDLDSDDGIPHYVRVQVAWQMHVADLDEIHVVALVGGPSGFRVFYVKRDLELEALIVAEADKAWMAIQARTAPPVDASSSCKVYLERLYPSPPEDVEVEITDDEEIMIGVRRVKAEVYRKRAEEAKDIASNELRELMGKKGATIAWCGLWRATWKADKNGQRSLKVTGRGELEPPKRALAPKPNAKRPPALVEDGDVF